METRGNSGKFHDVLILFEAPAEAVAVLVKSLRQHSGVQQVQLLSDTEQNKG